MSRAKVLTMTRALWYNLFMSLKQSMAKSGKNNPMYGTRSTLWKGGRKIHAGYWMIWKPEHPFAQKNGYVAEHRLVMEKSIGRYLSKNEVVHHWNHIKTDNRIANLFLTNSKIHQALHRTGVIMSDETKDKISKTRKTLGFKPTKPFEKGKPSWNKGIHTSMNRKRNMKGQFI